MGSLTLTASFYFAALGGFFNGLNRAERRHSIVGKSNLLVT